MFYEPGGSATGTFSAFFDHDFGAAKLAHFLCAK